jgi:hypothetical protein
LSEDPIGFVGGDTNLYRYCHNNPTNCVDPDGQFGILAVVGLGAAAGGIGGAIGSALAGGSWSDIGNAAITGALMGGFAMYGGVGSAVIGAGGTIGLTTSLAINPAIATLGGMVGAGLGTLMNFAEIIPSNSNSNSSNNNSGGMCGGGND